MLGVVNLDKPVGPTSHDMVGLLRRLTGTHRIGHAGTLDPLASGVLPILVGAATRFSEELTGGAKRYEAVVRLGSRSLTDDGEGPITASDAPLPADDEIRGVVREFVGTFAQRPPAFSARKVGGQIAHRVARRGELLDVPSREVTIHSIDVMDMERGADGVEVRIDLRCGAGTYVRSLARDLGERLGCGGYLRALRRTEAGGLSVVDAITPEDLAELAASGRFGEALIPVGEVLPLPRMALDAEAAWRFVHGSAQRVGDGAAGGRTAVFEGDTLLGIGSVDAGILQPQKVVPREAGK